MDEIRVCEDARILNHIIKAGGDHVNLPCLLTQFMDAGNTAYVRAILEFFTENQLNRTGFMPPLELAVCMDSPEYVEMILNKRADPNSLSFIENHLEHSLEEKKHSLEILKLLADAGAKLTPKVKSLLDKGQ